MTNKGRLMKRKGTGMGSRSSIAAISTLLMLVPVATLAQSGGNPWNPYPQPRSRSAPIVQPVPEYATPAPVQPTRILPRSQPPSRFAPHSLEQQLSTGANMPPARPDARAQPPAPVTLPNTNPPTYSAPAPGGFTNPTGPARQGYGGYPQGYNGNPQGYGGYPQGYNGGPQGYGGGPQGYGGYPQGYSNNNGYPGYGWNGPSSPYGVPPGGSGGFGSFPGNITNGGVPGFNLSPFGFF